VPEVKMRTAVLVRWATGVAAFALACATAGAQTVTCSITSTPMAFGVYDPGSPVGLGPVTSTIEVGCSVPPGSGNVAGFTMSLSLSTGSSGTYTERRMTSVPPRDTVRYNIYTSASPTATVWGDGTGSATVSLTIDKMTPGQSGRASALAYGFVPPLQNVAAGNYADVIVVTANW